MQPYFRTFPIRQSRLSGINPLMGGIQQCRGGYTFGPVLRQYYILEFVLSGKGVYTVEGQAYEVRAGEAFLIRPYETHLLRADESDPWEYVWLGFECDRPLPEPMASAYVFDAAAYRDLYTAIPESAPPSRYAAILFELMARMEEGHIPAEQPNDPVSRAEEIIRREFATITVQALADRFYLNRSYFGAIFKKATGKSPKAYIDEVRLSTAVRLMLELGYTATQAALATGYGDVMAFSKMYKRHFGISPRESLRNRHGKTVTLK